MIKNKSNDYWEKLLKMRYERLSKFIHLQVPMSIIATECRLIQEAYYRGFWRSIAKSILQRFRLRWKLWRMKSVDSELLSEATSVVEYLKTPHSDSGSSKPSS